MQKRKTAGALQIQASSDSTKYDSLEVGHALTDDIFVELKKCAHDHCLRLDEAEFCVGYVIAGDPLLHAVMRKKFFAFLFLPSPRPNQAVFLYRKSDDSLKKLWVLPNALTMACLSEMPHVDKKFKTMKGWSDAFFNKKFFELIRYQQQRNDLMSEHEYLNIYRDELIKCGGQDINPRVSDSFDFSKIQAYQIVDPGQPPLD